MALKEIGRFGLLLRMLGALLEFFTIHGLHSAESLLFYGLGLLELILIGDLLGAGRTIHIRELIITELLRP